MIETTADTIPNKKVIEILGICKGFAQIGNIEAAIEKLRLEAKKLGADAIVGIGLSENAAGRVTAYGTAVKLG